MGGRKTGDDGLCGTKCSSEAGYRRGGFGGRKTGDGVCLRTHACHEVQCCGGEVEERRSGGAEVRGAEAEHSVWWRPREVRAG